jgi:transcriptional regulator with XRE-family HTH domain
MKTKEQVKAAVAQNIKRFKKSEKMTYDDIGGITGVDERNIKAWVTGETSPSLYNAYLLSDAMGLTLNELINEQVS